MNEQSISLRSVNELRINHAGVPIAFLVPAYQRGFRWSKLQVIQLLEDIREFLRRPNPQPDDFYCLQPLVIRALPDGRFEVVDGQQRLTTILLLLRHFNERQVERYRLTLYSLEYETRPGLDEFLEKPTPDSASVNADFYHFYEAIVAIEEWFSQHESDFEDLKSALLNKTKVIWFRLGDADNPVDAFTRLNVGKIPLTNDELIRALFLRRPADGMSKPTDTQLRIAYEWDLIEKALQADHFWYFVSNEGSKTSSRIGFLFELAARAQGMAAEHTADTYGIFHHFNARLGRPGGRPELVWREIKQIYQTLEEWFEDRTLFHMVGFLISDKMPINDIRKLSQGSTKSRFEALLRDEIFRRTIGGTLPAPAAAKIICGPVDLRLEKLVYPKARREIRQVLLLFNLATLLMNERSNIRFQFNSFKNDAWDIEHIRSVAEDKPERHDDRRDWLSHCREYLQTQAPTNPLCKDIDAFLRLSPQDATNLIFDPLYDRILSHFGEGVAGDGQQGISNLTLLDQTTNRSYKNAVFAVKRNSIINLDQAGIFVPLCTRNVFLKCYSSQVAHTIIWTEDDRKGYQAALSKALVEFFSSSQGGGG